MRWILTLGDFQSSVGMLVVANWTHGKLTVEKVLQYPFPEARRVDGKGFTGARLQDDTLFVCGFNGIYAVETPSWDIRPWLIRDDFNDLHDLEFGIDQDRAAKLWVANTGLDRIDVFTTGGQFLGGIPLTEWSHQPRPDSNDPYYATGSGDDLPIYRRKLADRVHPNSLLSVEGDLLVGRFRDQAIASVTGDRKTLRIDGCPHDASIHGSKVWATTTDGRIWCWRTLGASDAGSDPAATSIDTFASTGRSGWCRGLSVHEDIIAVGLTRISQMPRARWCERSFEDTVTGLLLIARDSGRELAFCSLERFGEHPKLFSVVPFPSEASRVAPP